LLDITDLGLASATEFLDAVTAQYIKDLISWGAIGARTTESQIHRELASSLPCAIGFKNNTQGNVQIAIDAINCAQGRHSFYTPDHNGLCSITQSQGNANGHLILRGGKLPNYSSEDISKACRQLRSSNNNEKVIVDFSHNNSEKDHQKQIVVAKNITQQISNGSQQIAGVMIESFLVAGRQSLQYINNLQYGQSTTDACIDLIESKKILDMLAKSISSQQQLAQKAVITG